MSQAARIIVQFSGGAASYIAGKLAAEEVGPANVVFLFADTRIEDEDLYRFSRDVERKLGVPITAIADGRTPWDVFFDVRMMGNSRADPCSRILKRELLRRWLDANGNPETDTIIIGYDANEAHRFGPLQERYKPWRARAPLIERGIFKETALQMLQRDGIFLPRLYAMGFPHNNCGGFCIKAGQAQFAKLLEHFPDRYAAHEAKEEEFRAFIGKDVSILRDRRGKHTRPLTMRKFRERIQKAASAQLALPYDRFDLGGCGCMEPVGAA